MSDLNEQYEFGTGSASENVLRKENYTLHRKSQKAPGKALTSDILCKQKLLKNIEIRSRNLKRTFPLV